VLRVNWARFLQIPPIALLLICAGGTAEASRGVIEWRLSSSAEGVRVVYKLPKRADHLELGTPNDLPPEGSHIRVLDRGLVYSAGVVRGDRPFQEVTLLIAADARDIDAKYPLAVDLSRGAHLVYAPYLVPRGRARGAVLSKSGRWRSLSGAEAEGGFLILGADPPKGAVIGVSSANMPPGLNDTLRSRTAALMSFYRKRLGMPPLVRPLLVTVRSEHAVDQDHWLFRGDVTANGIVLLQFRGTPAQVGDPLLAGRYSAFLAHEIFHLWNRRRGGFPSNEAWLHEGAAEYYSWLAVSALWPGQLKLETRIEEAVKACSTFLGPRGLAGIKDADISLRYSCGAVAHWFTDIGTRSSSSGKQDGFALWSDVLHRRGADYSLGDFRAAAARFAPATGGALSELVGGGVEWPRVAQVLTEAGADVVAAPPGASAKGFAAAKTLALAACGAFFGAGQVGTLIHISAPDTCPALAGYPAIEQVNGIDVSSDPSRFYEAVKAGCEDGGILRVKVAAGEVSRNIDVRCNGEVAAPVSALHVRTAVPKL
jgi:hypothetical protein